MTTWLELRDAVAAAVTAAMPSAVRTPANLDGPTVSWADDRRPFAKHRFLLSDVSATFDHDRDSALSEGGAQELSTMATAVIQVTGESAHDLPSADARWLLEQIRLGLRKVSVRAELEDSGIAIVGFPGPTTSRKYPADGRTISAHSFDIAFRFILDGEATGEDAGLIEHVVDTGATLSDDVDVLPDVDDPDPEP